MRTRIGVVPPGSAQARLLFENDEIMNARTLKLDGHAQPRHARAQNHHLMMGCTGGNSC